MRYYLALGSNMGDRFWQLKTAVGYLEPIGEFIRKSSIYESKAYGYKDQPDFLNVLVEMAIALHPLRLLRKLKIIECRMGRKMSRRWGPRIIDIDIADWNDAPYESSILTIPHRELSVRRFVLLPLQEIAPDYHDKYQRTVEQLIRDCPDTSTVNRFKEQW